MAFSAFDITTTVRDEWLYSSGIQEILNHWPTHNTQSHTHTHPLTHKYTTKLTDKQTQRKTLKKRITNSHKSTPKHHLHHLHTNPLTTHYTATHLSNQIHTNMGIHTTQSHRHTQTHTDIIYIILYYIKIYYAIILYYTILYKETEIKPEHWTKRWNWSSCTNLALRVPWTHGLIAQSVRVSEGNQWSWVQIPLRPTFYSYFSKSCSDEYHTCIYIYNIYILYIYM